MSEELVFYTNPMSRGRIIRWMLEEVGQPYRTELMEYADIKSPAYLAINPMGKIPAIKHGDLVVTECSAICAYLADAFPQAGLAPPVGDKARGTYYRWLFFAAGPLESAMVTKMFGWEVPPERRRAAGWGCMEDVLATLETALDGKDYLAGDRFSAADLYLGAQLGYGMQFGSFEKRPVFERYFARLQSRPAAARAVEIDNALIPPQPQPATA
jgi:glutathione S-transferase